MDIQSIGAGEYLLPGEVILKKGESYVAPRAVATFSDRGLDGLTNNHYSWIRSRPHHITKVRPRPLTLNMWEAVYFNHNEEGIRKIVDKAAEIGVERLVLDDGWFGSRRNDKAGLGDWVVSKDAWPHGLIQSLNTSTIKASNSASGLRARWSIVTLIYIVHIQIGSCRNQDAFLSKDVGSKCSI
jgi:alpha-galactosidase